MGRTKQQTNGRGSLKDIQILINENPDLLNDLLIKKISTLKNDTINWLSPLESDDFAEYYDNDFIDLLGLKLTNPLTAFWPNNGCHWDALGKSLNGQVFLIEAKANIPEIVSSPSGAKIKSKLVINKSLIETKIFLNINNNIDWSGKFYQYTNRLANLYFLRIVNKIPAWLINIYFVNDNTVNGPNTKEEWFGALQVMKTYLGVGHHKLSKYMIDLFIDVEDFRQ